MKSLKVLMIAPTSFFGDYGCHVRILEEALALTELGHEVTVCTYHKGQDVPGITVERTARIPWREQYEVGSSLLKIAFDALLQVKCLSVALRKKPDIIHAHLHEGALIGYPISLLMRIPLIFDFQGSLTSEMIDHRFLRPTGFFYRAMRGLEQIINGLPKAIITNSEHATSLLRNEFGIHAKPIHIVPDSINIDLFQPMYDEEARGLLKAELGIPSGSKVVVYLGLLAEYQGIDLLLQGIAALRRKFPDVRFLIMGFPAVESYKLRAHQLGIQDLTIFTGKIPYWEAPRYLALGDLAVAPKISATEGCGKLLNYMAMGLPTVAFDTPVNREYLGEGGIYAEWGNSVAFAEAISSLLDAGEERSRLRRSLRDRAVERFSWQNAACRIVQLYQSCLHS